MPSSTAMQPSPVTARLLPAYLATSALAATGMVSGNGLNNHAQLKASASLS